MVMVNWGTSRGSASRYRFGGESLQWYSSQGNEKTKYVHMTFSVSENSVLVSIGLIPCLSQFCRFLPRDFFQFFRQIAASAIYCSIDRGAPLVVIFAQKIFSFMGVDH